MSTEQRIPYYWKDVIELDGLYVNARFQTQEAVKAMVYSATPENQTTLATAGQRMLHELIIIDEEYSRSVKPFIQSHNAMQEVMLDEIQAFLNCHAELKAYILKINGIISQIETYVNGE
ncbi:hypothetical protein [Vibrio phage BONAISHI]|nr:hypothetical protein [Vibrio phage BONAISHI]